MQNNHKGLRVLGILLFSIGVLLGLAFAGITIWANLEASLFDADMPRDASLGLHCPVMITSHEIGTVRATFTNIATWDVNLTVKAHISQGYVSLYREELVRLPLSPGQSQEVQWTVSPEDTVYGDLIFIRVANQRQAPILARMGTCGILVANLPLVSGRVLVIGIIIFAALFMVAGYLLWRKAGEIQFGAGRDVLRAMHWLFAAVTAAILCGVLRAWLPGVLVMVIALLLIAEVLRHYAQGRSTDLL